MEFNRPHEASEAAELSPGYDSPDLPAEPSEAYGDVTPSYDTGPNPADAEVLDPPPDDEAAWQRAVESFHGDSAEPRREATDAPGAASPSDLPPPPPPGTTEATGEQEPPLNFDLTQFRAPEHPPLRSQRDLTETEEARLQEAQQVAVREQERLEDMVRHHEGPALVVPHGDSELKTTLLLERPVSDGRLVAVVNMFEPVVQNPGEETFPVTDLKLRHFGNDGVVTDYEYGIDEDFKLTRTSIDAVAILDPLTDAAIGVSRQNPPDIAAANYEAGQEWRQQQQELGLNILPVGEEEAVYVDEVLAGMGPATYSGVDLIIGASFDTARMPESSEYVSPDLPRDFHRQAEQSQGSYMVRDGQEQTSFELAWTPHDPAYNMQPTAKAVIEAPLTSATWNPFPPEALENMPAGAYVRGEASYTVQDGVLQVASAFYIMPPRPADHQPDPNTENIHDMVSPWKPASNDSLFKLTLAEQNLTYNHETPLPWPRTDQ